MAQASSIEWTESTWNPITGCTKISEGCLNCYAERMARRLKAMGVPAYKDGFSLALHPEVLDAPRRWKKPRTIFVNSMSDLFHENVPLHFIQQIFAVINDCPQHTFQVLTKRPHLAVEYADQLNWSENIWMGTTVESAAVKYRVEVLRNIPATIKFLSLEPLLSAIPRLPVSGIDWVIVGGESGPGARPMNPDWVRQIRDRCITFGVPFFFKQWGGINKKKHGRLLDARTWDEIPCVESFV